MSAKEKLDAIGRIVVAIKEFRQLTGYTGDMFSSLSLNAHLKVKLSWTDFDLWTSLRMAEQTRFFYN